MTFRNRREAVDHLRNRGYEIVEILHRGAAILTSPEDPRKILVDKDGNTCLLQEVPA